MAEAKHVPLNGAYYGPPIPPQQTNHRHGGRRGGGCCGPCCVLKVIVSIILVLGIAALVLWLVFRPSRMKVHVTSAELTRFDFINNTYHYNLSLNVALRNPNKRIGIYYRLLEARAYYMDDPISSRTLRTFYQGHKNTTNLKIVFNGQAAVFIDRDELLKFNREKGEGIFSIDVKIKSRVRYKVGSIKTRVPGRFKPDFECKLRIPLVTNGSSPAVGFTRTKCDVEFK